MRRYYGTGGRVPANPAQRLDGTPAPAFRFVFFETSLQNTDLENSSSIAVRIKKKESKWTPTLCFFLNRQIYLGNKYKYSSQLNN